MCELSAQLLLDVSLNFSFTKLIVAKFSCYVVSKAIHQCLSMLTKSEIIKRKLAMLMRQHLLIGKLCERDVSLPWRLICRQLVKGNLRFT